MNAFRIATCAALPAFFATLAVLHAQTLDCDKNHYILDLQVPCSQSAIDAPIGAPGAVVADAHGNVYFSSPSIVFKLDNQNNVARVAGNGTAGYSGDGGPAVNALLSFPAVYPELAADPIDFSPLVGALALDAVGNLYIADAYNNRVRRVDLNGIITTVFGNGGKADVGESVYGRQPTDVSITWPQGVAVDGSGALYAASAYGMLLKVASPDGVAVLARPNCGAEFLGPGLCGPEGIAVDAEKNVFVVDGYCRVRVFGEAGAGVTVAGADTRHDGNGYAFTCGYSGDGGAATSAALLGPYSVAVDTLGNLFIADTYNNCIRKVDSTGIITTVAGMCGASKGAFSGDGGPATGAQLNRPYGVAVDGAGNLYIADTHNDRIRRVDANGVITTVAGNGN